MPGILKILWIIPVAPLIAAGILAFTRRPQRKFAIGVSVLGMVVALLVAAVAFFTTLTPDFKPLPYNFTWFMLGDAPVQLGWILDPLSASMAFMVTFVGLLIFIFSIGYMAHDENFTRFFCFLSLFAAAMLGVVIANSLLLLFISWELVGLASYLLIGFWYFKPSAAAAAKKAFIVTRLADLGFFLGMLWLFAQTGTLVFYDGGQGCLEADALKKLAFQAGFAGMTVGTAISLLILCGAMGKSGQVPFHVWLPDAMEGPTPVSALIHAATMVAAGVFLLARIYPLLAGTAALDGHPSPTTALTVISWVGAVTALLAALMAVAQTDIKRILAYSTVSQLGYMFLGIGVGGPAVGMFHLITHAFFKALLFLGAGSVIHGVGDEQDIRKMGGLRAYMPVTFATYAIGMMALSGVPLVFSGFWSKDEILHQAFVWSPSRLPFYMAVIAAFLTAFYMTRQMCYVFFGSLRLKHHGDADHKPHESPRVMTVPLILLAAGTVLLSVVGTPFWPWFHGYITGHLDHVTSIVDSTVLLVLLGSAVVSLLGITLAWAFYKGGAAIREEEPDPLRRLEPDVYTLFERKFYFDEFYNSTVVWFTGKAARWFDALDYYLWNGLVWLVSYIIVGLSWVSRFVDELAVNLGFDRACSSVKGSGGLLSSFQNGLVQRYLRVIGIGVAVLFLLLIWLS